jgi:hypothetical protein
VGRRKYIAACFHWAIGHTLRAFPCLHNANPRAGLRHAGKGKRMLACGIQDKRSFDCTGLFPMFFKDWRSMFSPESLSASSYSGLDIATLETECDE